MKRWVRAPNKISPILVVALAKTNCERDLIPGIFEIKIGYDSNIRVT